jgi:hypothetical protein
MTRRKVPPFYLVNTGLLILLPGDYPKIALRSLPKIAREHGIEGKTPGADLVA